MRTSYSRAADLVALGLTEMRGATAPRLLLELICARILLPGADHDVDGLTARLDRLEKRSGVTGGAPSTAPPVSHPASSTTPAARPAAPAPPAASSAQQSAGESTRESVGESAPPAQAPESAPAAAGTSGGSAHGRPAPAWTARSARHGAGGRQPVGPRPRPQRRKPRPRQHSGRAALSLVEVRQLWPDLVERTKAMRRLTWMLLTQHAQVVGVDEKTLTVGFDAMGPRESVVGSGSPEILRQAAIDVIGADWKVEVIVDPGGHPASPSGSTPSGPADKADVTPSAPPAPSAPAAPAAPDGPPAWATGSQEEAPSAPSETPPTPAAPADATGASAAARAGIRQTRTGGEAPPAPADDPDADVDPDDPDADSNGLDSAELLRRTLGAQVIEQIPND